MINKDDIKMITAILSFLCSAGMGIASLCIPPEGEIHSSVLIYVAQMLLFCATLLGLDLSLGHYGSTSKRDKDENKGKE